MEYYQHANQDGKVVLFCEIFAKNTFLKETSHKNYASLLVKCIQWYV